MAQFPPTISQPSSGLAKSKRRSGPAADAERLIDREAPKIAEAAMRSRRDVRMIGLRGVASGRAARREARRKPLSIADQLFALFTLSSAARRPFASFCASSFAQKCMKKRRG